MRRYLMWPVFLLFVFILTSPLPTMADEPCTEQAAVVLLIDGSGSMAYNDPERIRVEAARMMVDTLRDGDYLAVVEFSTGVRKLVPMREVCGDAERREVAALMAGAGQQGNTDTLGGLRAAYHQFEGAPAVARQLVILLSDGESDVPGVTNTAEGRESYFAETGVLLDKYRGQGRIVHCIAFHEEVAGTELTNIAARTGGQYHFVAAADDLKDILANLLPTIRDLPAAGAESHAMPATPNVHPAGDILTGAGKHTIVARLATMAGLAAAVISGAAAWIYPAILYVLPVLLFLLVVVRITRRDRVKGKLRVWVNAGGEVRYAKYCFRLGSAGKREVRVGTARNRDTDFTLTPLNREFSFLIRSVPDPYADRSNGRLRRLLFGPKMLYEVVCLPGTVMQTGEWLKTRGFLYDEDGFEVGGYVFGLQSAAVEKRPRGEDVLESHRPAEGPPAVGKKVLTLRVVGREEG